MGRFRTIQGESVRRTLEDAALRSLPVSVTVRHRRRWTTLQSWLVAEYGDFLWLDYPTAEDNGAPHEFQPGDKVSLKFQMRRRQYIFSASVIDTEPYERDDETPAVALKVTSPEQMQFADPRTHTRVCWPSDLGGTVLAWMGGRDDQPEGESTDLPIWSGTIINLSHGGALIRSDPTVAGHAEAGDLMALKMDLGQRAGEVVVDAQLRRAEVDGDMVLLGFQFIDDENAPPDARADLANLRDLVQEVESRQDEPAAALPTC